MSEDLDIRYGGAIAVDTEILRDIGTRLVALCTQFDDARTAVERAREIVSRDEHFDGWLDAATLGASGDQLTSLSADCRRASEGTLLMADAYEVVELRARAEALAVTDAAAAASVQARIDRLLAADTRVSAMVDWLVDEWREGRFDGLLGQFDLGGFVSPLFIGGALGGVVTGLGKVLPGMTLRGTADPVTVTAVRTTTPTGAPSGIAEAFRRFPSAAGAQVRVDRYVMPDGTRRFVAYVKGSQSVANGGSEPWDMRSNVQLYGGETSASYQATLDALAQAGAEPGDRVDVVAHSQGGAIAAHLSMESDYDVQVQITAGSPVEPTLRDDQVIVQLRHTDDVVSALAAGGSPEGTGSSDSFTAERVGDPARGFQDLALAPHQLEAYIDTAEQVDESGDVRVRALDDYWAELDDAVEITATEYRATRDE
ncbi:MAG: hypothetical protein P0Y60_00600 [Candidatus Microbacterium colombiense]|nr:MAG: hypothetical protein P0Y60_00600 [Microbacterium sp.]